MNTVEETWTCPRCRRTTVVCACPADTAAALEAVRLRHEHGHPATPPVSVPAARRPRP